MDDEENRREVLPGFRFHPTEEELVGFYLRRKVEGKPFKLDLIEEVKLCNYDPWDLPGLADRPRSREWFFFVSRDGRHQSHRGTPNRLTVSGFWKTTGTDRRVYSQSMSDFIGLKKTLVFYLGKAPKGQKTDWIMNEYRLARSDQLPTASEGSTPNAFTVCRIYRKGAMSITSFDRRPRIEVERRELTDSSSSKPLSAQISTSSKHGDVSVTNLLSPNELQLHAPLPTTAENPLTSAIAKPTSEAPKQIPWTSIHSLSDQINENGFPSLEGENSEAISLPMAKDCKGKQEDMNARYHPSLAHINSFGRWDAELIYYSPSSNVSGALIWNQSL